MTYKIRILATKQQGTLWYHQSGEPNVSQILTNISHWNMMQPGYIDRSIISVNENVIDSFIRFDTKANGDAWYAAAQIEPNHVIRDTYLQSIGVHEDITFIEE